MLIVFLLQGRTFKNVENIEKITVFSKKMPIKKKLFSVNKKIKVIRKSASFLVKFDLKPHQTFVILLFHFPC
jgi:hypothetical protein